jgi:hypothetical protein
MKSSFRNSTRAKYLYLIKISIICLLDMIEKELEKLAK